MTTIAYDGRYLAADRWITQRSEIIAQLATKISIDGNPPVVFASTGMITEGWRAALAKWWLNGHDPDAMPSRGGAEARDIGNLIILDLAGIKTLSYVCPYPDNDTPPCAWGSGADYATGAMLAGKTAMEAVEIASRRDANSGGGVQFVDTQFLSSGVQIWDGVMPSARFPMPLAS